MSFINYKTKEIHCKIVYYGPGLSGKTTNLQYIYHKTTSLNKSTLISLDTQTERTLFFDFLPLSVGKIRGFRVRFHLYTVPGQVFYDASRKLILKGADGVVFVADSQVIRFESNLESFQNLEQHLQQQGLQLRELPHVIQFNKRDMDNISSTLDLSQHVNPYNAPEFEAIAVKGFGVFETLKGIAKLVLRDLKSTSEEVTPSVGLSPTL